MNRIKMTKSKLIYILLAVAVAAGLFPLSSSYAQQAVNTSVTAYQFTDTTVKVMQIMPFYDSGVAVLFNDDSVVIYQQQDGRLLKSRVARLSNVRRLIDETRAVTNDQKVVIWDPYSDSYAYSAQVVAGLSNVAAATPHYYVTQEGSDFHIKYYDGVKGDSSKGAAEDLFTTQNVKSIADSGTGGILLKNDGTVYCWDGEDKAPVKKEGLADIVSIDNNAALSAAGEVYTWGSNVTGKLGNGSGADSTSETPVKVTGLPKIKAITATESQVYAIAEDGTLYQWGESNDANFARITTPQKVSGVAGARQVFAAAHTHNAAYVLDESDGVTVLGYSAVDANTLQGLLSPKTAITTLGTGLSKSIVYQGALTGLPNENLKAHAADGNDVTVAITSWECDTGFNPQIKGDYQFRPVFSIDGNYKIVDSIIPVITVSVNSGTGSMTSNEYSINAAGGCVSKIAAGTTARTLKQGISVNGGAVRIMNGDSEAADDTPIGTGMKVELYVGNAKVQSLTAIVTGDVNGDGKISIADYSKIKSDILDKEKLSNVYRQSADINADGNITIADYSIVKSYILGKSTIDPRAY